jgi:hypothetical protein
MTALSIDDKFPRNPKIVLLSDAAFRLHMHALAHCAEHETDGFIDARLLPGLSKHRDKAKLVGELCSAKGRPDGNPLWIEVDGGWRIHGYLDWNDSHEELEAKRIETRSFERRVQLSAIRAAAGKAGGKRSGESRSQIKLHFGDERSKGEANVEANIEANTKQNGEATSKQNGSNDTFASTFASTSRARPNTDLSDEINGADQDLRSDPLINTDGYSGRARAGERRRRAVLALDWSPGEAGFAFAAARGWSKTRAEAEFESFANHHVAKQTLSASWDASWRTWVLNGIKFDAERGVRSGRPHDPKTDPRKAIVQRDPEDEEPEWLRK